MRRKGRDNSGERGVWDAEYSCSVTAAPFTQPVRPVFVMFDVSIKTKATPPKKPNKQKKTPPPANRTAITTPVLRRDQHHLSPTTLPQTPSVFLPPPPFGTYIHTRGSYCLWGHTPNIREERKEQWRPEKKYRPEVRGCILPPDTVLRY